MSFARDGIIMIRGRSGRRRKSRINGGYVTIAADIDEVVGELRVCWVSGEIDPLFLMNIQHS